MEEIHQQVRRRYAAAATGNGCCGGSVAADTYDSEELRFLPAAAVDTSLGCGNPTAVAELGEGETVLDLGSGGGLDTLLAARRVGRRGRVYGVDMTEEMLDLARRNAAAARVDNVEFLEGYIEDIPLPDASVDVIISNCVINLAADKSAVFSEMWRVLRPGGRVGVTDIVADDSLSAAERQERGSWVGCIAGALSVSEYETGLAAAGFQGISLTPTHNVAEGMHSMIVRATKPPQP